VHSFTNGVLPLTLANSASTPVVTVSATLTDSHGVNSYTSSATLVNSGSNSLTELAGGDTFVFSLSANGSAGAPHVETISAFNTNAGGSGGDVLNLADLLNGVSPSATAATLANYLHFTEVPNGSGGYTTTVHVNTSGAFSGGYSAAADTLQIVLTNADLLHSAGSLQTDTQIIQNLINQHKLVG
jgi:large repetitive protein